MNTRPNKMINVDENLCYNLNLKAFDWGSGTLGVISRGQSRSIIPIMDSKGPTWFWNRYHDYLA